MNRKKKVNQILKKRMKKANAKLHTSNKPRYISKAERAKMELEAQNTENPTNSDSVSTQETASEDNA